jgi:hypothetical protein
MCTYCNLQNWVRDADVLCKTTATEAWPDGRLVVVAAGTKTAQILRVFPSTQDLIAYSRQVLPRCLTREQRDFFSLNSDPPKWCIDMKKWALRLRERRTKRSDLTPLSLQLSLIHAQTPNGPTPNI